MKKIFVKGVLCAALLLLASQETKANVLSEFFYGGENKISDNSAEFLFNRTGSSTTLDTGDVLISPFTMGTVEDLTGTGGTAPVWRQRFQLLERTRGDRSAIDQRGDRPG